MKTGVCVSSGMWKGVLFLFPLLLMFALGLTPGISMQEDLGRHLLLGRIITETGSVPETNLLTYTCPDYPFINHHWLSEVLFYNVHQAMGLNGLIVCKALLLVAALWLAMHTLTPGRCSALYLLAGILAAVILGFRSHIRPELFTYLGVALFGWCFERIRRGQRLMWLVLVLYAWFWANAHIYFIFGLGMVGAFLLERWWLRWRAGVAGLRQFPWIEGIFTAGLLGVCLLQPNGVDGLLYPFRIFGNYGVEITENGSPLVLWETVLNPMLLALPWVTALALASLLRVTVLRPRKVDDPPRLADYVILSAGLIAAWSMARSTPLLALTVLPVIGEWRGFALREKENTTVSAGVRVHRALSCVGACLASLLSIGLLSGVLSGWYIRIFPSPIGPTPFGLDSEERFLALRRLAGEGLPMPVFSDYNIGSLVEYNIHPFGGYVDNRPEAFPESFWNGEYRAALLLGEDWEQIRRVRGIQTVIVSPTGVKEGYLRAMMENPAWSLVHLDVVCAVWVLAENPANADFIHTHAYDQKALDAEIQRIGQQIDSLSHVPIWRRQILADDALYTIYSLFCIGVVEESWPLLWRLHERYPDWQVVHELLRVMAPPDQVDAVKKVMERRARWPLSAKQVLDWAAVLESEQRIQEAHEALRRGSCFFPLSREIQNRSGELDGQ